MDKLKKLLRGMDLPVYRKEKLNKANLMWLARNIRVRNAQHAHLEEAEKLIQEALNSNTYNS